VLTATQDTLVENTSGQNHLLAEVENFSSIMDKTHNLMADSMSDFGGTNAAHFLEKVEYKLN
jgi:hypothetical protein